jgi:DNA-directed RNA polymerase specialized sigma subunit
MNIVWQYLDKRAAAINALKDYSSMKYIIEHTDEDIANLNEEMTSPASPVLNGMPSNHDPKAGEKRLIACINEIDVLKERYRQALEYMDWFQPAWDALSEDEQLILTEFFINNINKTDAISNIGDKLFLERAQVYRRKEKALNHLALLLYGK